MKENYRCSICGKTHRKLWRPYMDIEPLACASCLEKRQVSLKYKEYTYIHEKGHLTSMPTGKLITLPEWTVNQRGLIPSYSEVESIEHPSTMTNRLIVDLSDVSITYSGNTDMIPAVPKEDGDFYGYTTMPEEACKWWENLPTQ